MTCVPNTEYVVEVSAKGYCAERVTVDVGRTDGVVRVALKKGLVIKGIVLERETGIPVDGARIRLKKKEPEGERWVYYQGRTDDHGVTADVVLGPGLYDIEVFHVDYSVMKERIEVASPLAAEAREFVWSLDLAGSLRGRFRFDELGPDQVFDHVLLSMEARGRDVDDSASAGRYQVDVQHVFRTRNSNDYFDIENIKPGEYDAFLITVHDQQPLRTFLQSVEIRRGEQSLVEFSASGIFETAK